MPQMLLTQKWFLARFYEHRLESLAEAVQITEKDQRTRALAPLSGAHPL
jgi:hypothetical protein